MSNEFSKIICTVVKEHFEGDAKAKKADIKNLEMLVLDIFKNVKDTKQFKLIYYVFIFGFALRAAKPIFDQISDKRDKKLELEKFRIECETKRLEE